MSHSPNHPPNHPNDPPHLVLILDPRRQLAAAVDVHGMGSNGSESLLDVPRIETAGEDQGVRLPNFCCQVPVGPLPRSPVAVGIPGVNEKSTDSVVVKCPELFNRPRGDGFDDSCGREKTAVRGGFVAMELDQIEAARPGRPFYLIRSGD